MRINHNIPALRASSSLGKTNSQLDKSLERLSSGYRINRAADDAAGMAISKKMRTQISGLEQASRNGSDGISVIQTAEGALGEVESMAQRMRELAVQAANGTNTADDRAAIQAEVDQLNQEIERISNTTEFNTKKLLNGEVDRKSYSNNTSVQLISVSDGVDIKDYNLVITKDARQAVLVGDSMSITEIDKETAGSININGEDISFCIGDDEETIFEKIRTTCEKMNILVFSSTGQGDEGENLGTAGYEPEEFGTGSLIFVSKAYGSDQSISIHCNNQGLADMLGISTDGATGVGFDADATLGEGFNTTATLSSKGNIITVTDIGGIEMKFESKPGTAANSFQDATTDGSTESESYDDGTESEVMITVLDAGPMDLQIGANAYQTMEVKIPQLNPKTLGIDGINMGTADGAQLAIASLDLAINQISNVRAKLGAYQNRLEYGTANLDTTSENMTGALSRIEDTNMAKEMTEYTQRNVLSQAGTSMLAQANQRPQTILSLLQN